MFGELEDLMPVMVAAVKRHLALPDAAIGKAGRTAASPPRALARACLGPYLAARRKSLNLILAGHSTKSLAAQLAISIETVRVHRRHIYAKLGIVISGRIVSLVSCLPWDITLLRYSGA